MPGYLKLIQWYYEPAAIACDGRCDKAWGISSRPKEQLSEDEDDYAWLADGELGIAPEDPGTSEGNDSKPLPNEPKLNKWCARECERCALNGYLQSGVVEQKDFSKRVYNMKQRADT